MALLKSLYRAHGLNQNMPHCFNCVTGRNVIHDSAVVRQGLELFKIILNILAAQLSSFVRKLLLYERLYH